jgi:hypothetical protein
VSDSALGESAGKAGGQASPPPLISLLDVIWHMLTIGEVFADLGADYFTSRQDKERQTRRLVSQLEKLGYTVQLAAT